MPAPESIPRPLLLYDGECGLCARSVRFVLRHDARGRIRFAALQSPLGARVLEAAGLDPEYLSSMVFVDEAGEVETRSTAVLRMVGDLKAPWRWARALLIVPRFLRDAAYRLLARSRYRVFGRADACTLPSPENAGRFLGDT